jgi:ElaB/YqjD/DUF883 family membrane-anchored ribosome-binding protein
MTDLKLSRDAASRTVDSATSGAHKAIDTAVDTANETLRPAVKNLVVGAHDTVDRLSSVASNAADRLEATGHQLKVAQSRATESCRTFVQEQPLTSLGIALASGLVLGLALRSR